MAGPGCAEIDRLLLPYFNTTAQLSHQAVPWEIEPWGRQMQLLAGAVLCLFSCLPSCQGGCQPVLLLR